MENQVNEAKNSRDVLHESPRSAQEQRPIYVGRLFCGCAVAATIDADDVAEMARNGYFIETVYAATVQVGGCDCETLNAPERDAETQ